MAVNSKATAGLEPACVARMEAYAETYGHVSEETGQSMVMHSIAISLKRIADTQDALLLFYGAQRGE